MKIYKRSQAYSRRYGRGIGTFLQGLDGSLFQGGYKDLAKSLLSAGKQYAKPILNSAIKNITPLVTETRDQIASNLLKNKDQYVDALADFTKNKATNITRQVLTAKDKNALKGIIEAEKKDLKNTGKLVGNRILKDATASIQAPIKQAIKDSGNRVVKPVINDARLEGIIKASHVPRNSPTFPAGPKPAQAPPIPNNVSVANLIHGTGTKQKKTTKAKYDFTSGNGITNFGEGLINFGETRGRGLLRI